METKHAYGEPWRESSRSILSDYPVGDRHPQGGYWVANVFSQEKRRRIIACVNACEGLDTEALEGGVMGELVEALEGMILRFYYDKGNVEEIQKAREALAKAKGEAV